MGGRSTSTTTQSSGPPAVQLPYLQDLFSRAQTQSQTPLKYLDFDPTADFDPAEVSGQESMLNYARGGARDAVGGAQNAWQFALNDALSPDSNPNLRRYGDVLAEDIGQDYSRNVIPAISGEAVAAGQTGSSRHGIAEGLASQDMLRRSAGARTQLYSTAYGQGLDAQSRALALSPQMVSLGAIPAQFEAAVGAQRRDLAQTKLDEQAEKHWFEQLAPWQLLAMYQSIVGGQYGGEGQITAQQPSSLLERII